MSFQGQLLCSYKPARSVLSGSFMATSYPVGKPEEGSIASLRSHNTGNVRPVYRGPLHQAADTKSVLSPTLLPSTSRPNDMSPWFFVQDRSYSVFLLRPVHLFSETGLHKYLQGSSRSPPIEALVARDLQITSKAIKSLKYQARRINTAKHP